MEVTEGDIQAQALSFKLMLKHYLNDEDLWGLLSRVSRHDKAYIFSGIIRDFLTGMIVTVRDLDIVLERTLYLRFILNGMKSNLTLIRNGFGGMKVKYRCLSFDVWGIKDTYSLRHRGSLRATPEDLLDTVFFNFSSILYDFNKERFILSKHFLDFINSQVMDVVNPTNPDVPLCIVNTLYYQKKFGFGISRQLKRWILENYHSSMSFSLTQKRHFGEVKFQNKEIENFVAQLRSTYIYNNSGLVKI